MTRFLFWDIDGTLLTTGRAGIYAMEDAAEHVLGRRVSLQDLRTAGLTDAQIAALIIEDGGLEPTRERVDAFLGVYEERLPAALPRKQGRVMPNVREILAALARRDDVHSLLLTGNTEAGARAKLTHYGLVDFFPDQGAFCTDGGARAGIARRARGLAEQIVGQRPPGHAMVVIGDTPHDIECGRDIGARVIAVATGGYSSQELEEHDPDLLFEELPRFPEFISAALSASGECL